jgi:hypothetical protein
MFIFMESQQTLTFVNQVLHKMTQSQKENKRGNIFISIKIITMKVLVNHEPNKGIDGQGSESLNQQTKRAKERNPHWKQSINIA